jgi:GTP-binding protein
MFVDEVTLSLRAGDGGHGCLSFRRERCIPRGGPDGGDGGDGGDLILLCDRNVGDLSDYHYIPEVRAESGQPGMGAQRQGKRGKDRILRVPEGTEAFWVQTGERAAELLRDGVQVLFLRGGRGGLGNEHFKTSRDQAPRHTVPGAPGERGLFRLEMRTIADVGLVGFPNAGKSTLTNLLTRTRRKTGPYPFTTLHPKVGTVDFADSSKNFRIADIPGLIEGAHRNRGLGSRFLRHIERCSLLAFVLDMSAADGRSPLGDLHVLREELGHHSPALLQRPAAILANKMDLPQADENLRQLRAIAGELPIFPISCMEPTCAEGLKINLQALISRHPERT